MCWSVGFSTSSKSQMAPTGIGVSTLILSLQTECSPELVRQIMRQLGLVACQPRPFRVTTEADAEAAASMPDLLGRDFTADRPGIKFKWLSI